MDRIQADYLRNPRVLGSLSASLGDDSPGAAFLSILSRMVTAPPYSLRARYVFPVDRPPIRDGWLVVSAGHGHILNVGQEPAGERRDLGDVAILPAFTNAHTHLEFSHLEKPLGEPGMSFTEWIRAVVQGRRATNTQPEGVELQSDAIRRGLAESIRGGATTLGDIATLPWADSDLRHQEMPGVNFLELLGLANSRHDELLAAARKHVATTYTDRWTRPGLSPHAPYTVSPTLVASVAALSAQTRAPVAMHLAETREEIELLRSGSGPFRDLLEELDAWHSGVIQQNSTPLDYLKLLAKADRSLIIHGNYLSQEEIDFAGQHNERMSIVYCPRTHAYFAHDPYPLLAMLAGGVNVALGTDSRASNPDLNMLSELRFTASQHQDVSPETILRLATINAAKALGIDSTYGTLTPGKQADFLVLPVSPHDGFDPHELLFDSIQSVEQVFRKGEQLWPLACE